jgi:hypothetical protein
MEAQELKISKVSLWSVCLVDMLLMGTKFSPMYRDQTVELESRLIADGWRPCDEEKQEERTVVTWRKV